MPVRRWCGAGNGFERGPGIAVAEARVGRALRFGWKVGIGNAGFVAGKGGTEDFVEIADAVAIAVRGFDGAQAFGQGRGLPEFTKRLAERVVRKIFERFGPIGLGAEVAGRARIEIGGQESSVLISEGLAVCGRRAELGDADDQHEQGEIFRVKRHQGTGGVIVQ